MCLIRIQVTIAGEKRKGLDRYCGRLGTREVPVDVSLSHGEAAALDLSPNGDCSCGFLTPGADVDANSCDLVEDIRPSLAIAVAQLHDKSPRGIAFTTGRVGDSLEHTERVKINHLTEIIRDNRINARTRYLVAKMTVNGRGHR